MSNSQCARRPSGPRVGIAVVTTLSTALLGACAQSGESVTSLLNPPAETQVAESAAGPDTRTELEKATDYWGKKYREKPSDKSFALSYAKNLRALGEKRKALAVLQQASMLYGNDREVASEYGRLALELDQMSIAKQMLAIAEDPGNPDWRVVSAKGTILAKEGKFSDAIPLFERALMLSREQTSVMNNLAMAYAMGGEAARAEEMLRKIEVAGGTPNPKIRQNLALVLGLQGKFDESKAIASTEIGQDGAAQNASLLRQFVKASPEKGAPAVAGWRASVGDGKPAAAKAAATTADSPAPTVSAATFEPAAEPVVTEPLPPPSRAKPLVANDPSAPALRGPTR